MKTICLNCFFRVLYGGITISSVNQTAINVSPANVQKRKQMQNITETLKKLKKMQTGTLTISKTVVGNQKPTRKCRVERKCYADDDDNDDDEIEAECKPFDDEDDDPNFDGCVSDGNGSVNDDVSDDDVDDVDDVDDDDDEDYELPNKQTKKSKRKPPKHMEKFITTKANDTNSNSISIKINAPPVYLCMKCKNRFKSLEELKEHVSMKNLCTKSQLICNMCSKTFETKKKLSQHIKIHQEKAKFICDKCGKMYTNQLNLENHKSSVHGDYLDECENVYKCRLCYEKYNNRTDLYAHMKRHAADSQPLLCDTCGKCFSSNHNLRAHMRNHLDIRPHACTFCPKRFRTRLLLKQHLHVHTGIKEFQCAVCSQQFAKQDSLRIHLRKRHSDYQPVPKRKKESEIESKTSEESTSTNGEVESKKSDNVI